MPVGIRSLVENPQYSLCKIQALNNAKPLILGFPSKEASMVAEFFIPILQRQGSFVVAIKDKAMGHVAR
ncbi:hypothetical protein PG993_011607 [Apiospora rasikravindrae]|uniref:Uncharacterized protein n=1 Tax=Apiospora rasikravindrae TaxID=990691 RepID=A0ABR1S1P8_9PEZI